MRFCITWSLILLFKITFSQDSCFERRLPTIDDYFKDTVYPIPQRIHDYIKSFDGCTAPEFDAITLDGKNISSKQLKGRVVVLNFWFTRCKPCVGEFPSLNKLAEEFLPKGVTFISFALDSGAMLDSFLFVHPLKYQLVPAAKKFSELFKVWPYPTNIILGKDYRVVKIFDGGNTKPEDALKNYDKFKPVIEAELEKK